MYTTIASRGHHDMLVVIALNRLCGCVELLAAYFLWKLARCLLVPWKLDLMEETSGQFWLWVFLDLWNLHLKFIVYSTVEIYLPLCGTIKSNYDNLKCFGSLSNSPSQQLNRASSSGVEVFVRWSLALEGNIAIPDEKSYFKLYMCIYTETYVL